MFVALINTLMLVFCSSDAPCTEHHVTVPRDCLPGRLLLSLEYVGQTFQMSTAKTPPSSRHFAVLANGDVICTSASPDVGTVSFAVECRLGMLAWTELIHVTVAEDREILVSFTQSYFEGRIVENAPPNSIIDGLNNIAISVSNFQGRVVADVSQQGAAETSSFEPVSEDTGSQTSLRVKFSITEGPLYMFHLVNNGNGSVALRTLVELDFERQSQYVLLAVAELAGRTASARLRVYVDNINDNAPTLDRSEYHFRFDEPAKTEVVVPGPDITIFGMRVTAFDADDDPLTYSIDGRDAEEFFIDQFTGEIYFRNRAARQRDFEFRVYTDDGLHRSDPGVVKVRVGGTDRDPPVGDDVVEQSRSRRDVRPLRVVEVPENMIGDLVDIGSTRGRPGRQFFAFREPAPRQLELGALTGTVRVRPGERLDFETQPEIDFVVTVTSVDDASGTVCGTIGAIGLLVYRH